MYYKFVLYQCQSCVTILYIITVITEIKIIAILVNNAFKTVQQSAKDKEDICRRADTRQRYLTQDFTLWWAGLRCIISEDCYSTGLHAMWIISVESYPHPNSFCAFLIHICLCYVEISFFCQMYSFFHCCCSV